MVFEDFNDANPLQIKDNPLQIKDMISTKKLVFKKNFEANIKTSYCGVIML